MSIDLNALRRATQGDPASKVAVKREWLVEVLKSLEELERIKTQRKIGDTLVGMMEHMQARDRFRGW